MSESKFISCSIDKLELDLNNPRIAKFIEMYGGDITAEQMSLALGAGETLSSGVIIYERNGV